MNRELVLAVLEALQDVLVADLTHVRVGSLAASNHDNIFALPSWIERYRPCRLTLAEQARTYLRVVELLWSHVTCKLHGFSLPRKPVLEKMIEDQC